MAASFPNPSWLSVPVDAEISHPSPTRYDVARAHRLLEIASTLPASHGHRTALPSEISLYILDLAEYWPSLRVHRTVKRRVPRFLGDLLYLSTPALPTGCQIKRITFKTVTSASSQTEEHDCIFEIAMLKARWQKFRAQSAREDEATWDPPLDEHTLYNIFAAEEKGKKSQLQGPQHLFWKPKPARLSAIQAEWDERTTTLDRTSVPILRLITVGTQLGVFVRTEAMVGIEYVKEVDCIMYIT
jgi:hypothetical protein